MTNEPTLPTPQRKGAWLQTHSGIAYWPLDPRPDEVNIGDIAHSLSMQCRYMGHVDRFYSVAEHCVHVSNCVPPEDALDGLLHDAPEAYTHDIVRPLKRYLGNYAEIELVNWAAVARAFSLPLELPESVHMADTAMLFVERKTLMREPPAPWALKDPGVADHIQIQCWSPEEAKIQFLIRATDLFIERRRKSK